MLDENNIVTAEVAVFVAALKIDQLCITPFRDHVVDLRKLVLVGADLFGSSIWS